MSIQELRSIRDGIQRLAAEPPIGQCGALAYHKQVITSLLYRLEMGPMLSPTAPDMCAIVSCARDALRNALNVIGIAIPSGEQEETARKAVERDTLIALRLLNSVVEKEEAHSGNSRTNKYYLMTVIGGVEPVLHGPYLTVMECTRAALALKKAIDPTCDSLFYLILDHQGTLAAGSYSEGFLEQAEKEPVQELIDRIESLRDNLSDQATDSEGWIVRELGEIAAAIREKGSIPKKGKLDAQLHF